MTAAKPWHLLPPRTCRVCPETLVQREHETDYLFARREVCGASCQRRTRMTQAEKGRASWSGESSRQRRAVDGC